jgi:uncharacterized protein (DUF2225 family)
MDLNVYRNVGKFQIFKKDEVVYKSGDSGDCMYVVMKGTFNADGKQIAEGGYFGELSVIDEKIPRAETAVCEVQGAMAVAVGRENLTDLLTCDRDISAKILAALYERAIALEHDVLDKGTDLDDFPQHLISPAAVSPENDSKRMGELAGRICGLSDILAGKNTPAARAIRFPQENQDKSGESDCTPILPEGHGSYTLTPANDSDALAVVKTDCPLCGRNFDNHFLLSSKLRRTGSDPDMRVRFAGIEPMHYNITTCPDCLFSAESEVFTDASKRAADDVFSALAPYKGTQVKIGRERDIDSVFKSYYLALICAPIVTEKFPDLTVAGLWIKIMRLYEDCGDKSMYEYAFDKTFAAYNHVYSSVRIPDKQSQQVAYILAELNFKRGNYDEARQLFHPLKKAPGASASFVRAVEDRLETIRREHNE